LIPATQEGNATIIVTRDPATTAVNYPVGSVNVLVPVKVLQKAPPTIKVTVIPSGSTIEFLDNDIVGATKVVRVELEAPPIGGQVVLDVSGTPNPFGAGAPFTVSTSTLLFKEGSKGPQEFGVIRLTDGVFTGSITIKLNPSLTTASNFLTSDINFVIPVKSAVGSIQLEYGDSVDCTNNLGKLVIVNPKITIQGRVLRPLTFKAEPEPPPPDGFSFDRPTGAIRVQCSATTIGSTLLTLVTVTDSSSPPISAQARVNITVK